MASLFDLTNRDIWVIGGAGLLGTAVVKTLVEHGASVLCVDLDNRAHEMVAREKLEAKVTPERIASSDSDFVQGQLKQRGTPHALVVMTYKSFPKSMNDLQPSEFDEANRVSLTQTFVIARGVGNAMAERGDGSIVLFSSMYGTVSPDPAMYPAPILPNPIEYGVGKAGIQQMSRYLAVHWGPRNVRCNSISPGPFPYPSMQESHPEWMQRIHRRSPMGRIGRPVEMAGAVVYLVSDASTYVTGHNLAVDGGWTAW